MDNKHRAASSSHSAVPPPPHMSQEQSMISPMALAVHTLRRDAAWAPPHYNTPLSSHMSMGAAMGNGGLGASTSLASTAMGMAGMPLQPFPYQVTRPEGLPQTVSGQGGNTPRGTTKRDVSDPGEASEDDKKSAKRRKSRSRPEDEEAASPQRVSATLIAEGADVSELPPAGVKNKEKAKKGRTGRPRKSDVKVIRMIKKQGPDGEVLYAKQRGSGRPKKGDEMVRFQVPFEMEVRQDPWRYRFVDDCLETVESTAPERASHGQMTWDEYKQEYGVTGTPDPGEAVVGTPMSVPLGQQSATMLPSQMPTHERGGVGTAAVDRSLHVAPMPHHYTSQHTVAGASMPADGNLWHQLQMNQYKQMLQAQMHNMQRQVPQSYSGAMVSPMTSSPMLVGASLPSAVNGGTAPDAAGGAGSMLHDFSTYPHMHPQFMHMPSGAQQHGTFGYTPNSSAFTSGAFSGTAFGSGSSRTPQPQA